MSTHIDAPIVLTEVKAETLPLPESRPGSPTKVDERTTTPPVNSSKNNDGAVAGATEDASFDPDSSFGSNKSNCGSSDKSASVADADCDKTEQGATDKSESDSAKLESANDSVNVIDAHCSESIQLVTDVNASIPEDQFRSEIDNEKIEVAATKSSEQITDAVDAKLMDPNDIENKGNVARTFFISEVESQGRCLSPIHEQGNSKLKLSEMADLFVKATDADGRVSIFQVYSATLEAASTVFYNMVYASNTRGNKEEWVWELDDSVIGLKVMFSLLHLNYCAALFTHQPNSHQVYEVLRVLAKYGIRDEAFHPFVKSWVAGFRKGLDDTSLTYLERLFTAYKLGDFKTLKISIRKVAHKVEISEDGSLLFDKKAIQEVVPITDELVANIRAVRAMDLKNILGPLKTAYETLMGDTNDQNPVDFCNSTDGHDECNEKLLGSLLGNLRRQKLRPIPVAATYNDSVASLTDKVSQMDIRGLIVPNLEPHKQRHGRCKLGQDDVAKQLQQCKTYLSIYDDLVEQMVVTAKRAGTDKDEKEEFEDYKDLFNKASIKYDEGMRHDVWGWDENAKSASSEALLPTDDSGIGEDFGFKERKA